MIILIIIILKYILHIRRINAISISKYVNQSINNNNTIICGYHVRLYNNIQSNTTKIIYLTTGILINKILKNNINKCTHIIIDEIHERTLDIDLLILLIKYFKLFKSIKLIFMSATIDINVYYNCFKNDNVKINHIKIPGKIYPVQQIYYRFIISSRK